MASDRNGFGVRLPAKWVAASVAALLIVGAGIFVGGFVTNELVSEDDGTSAVAQRNPSEGTPSAQATPQGTPTPLPAIAVSVDDAPSWGPTDAKVTVVEFGDYQ